PTLGAKLPGATVVMRARGQDDATTIWLMSVANDPSQLGGQPVPASLQCLFNDEMTNLFSKSTIVTQQDILKWGEQDNVDRMLPALSGSTDDWSGSFLANPRGLFFKKAANRDSGAPACPNIPAVH